MTNLKEDDIFVKRTSRKLKAFFFGLADSVVRLLLFLPDFLVQLEDFLFDMRDDSWIEKEYKRFDEEQERRRIDAQNEQQRNSEDGKED